MLKGHPPEQFIKEAWRKLKPKGKLYITGLDHVSLGGEKLPIFKDRNFLLNWCLYIPLNGSSPRISQEPYIKKNYKRYGVLPHEVIRKLLWRCGLKPETIWKVKEDKNYRYYKYTITVQK
jgi:SAM-dependent methyltransferase